MSAQFSMLNVDYTITVAGWIICDLIISDIPAHGMVILEAVAMELRSYFFLNLPSAGIEPVLLA